MKTTSHALGALVMLLMLPASAPAQEDWQVGTTPSFSSGRYRTNTRTEVLHTPIIARRLFKNADLMLAFPMTCVWGDPGVTIINGTPVRTERLQAAGATTPPADTGRGGATSPRAGDGTTPSRTTGDVARTADASSFRPRSRPAAWATSSFEDATTWLTNTGGYQPWPSART